MIIKNTLKNLFSQPTEINIVKLGTIVAGGNVISSIIRFFGGVLIAKLLAPQDLGLYNGIALVLSYLPLFHLGALDGFHRELPYYLGKNEINKAKDFASTAKAWALFLSLLCFIVFTGIGLFFITLQNELIIGICWLANGFGAFSQIYGQYYLTSTYRTNNEFSRLTNFTIIGSVISLVAIIFVDMWGVVGLAVRNIFAGLSVTFLLFKRRPIPLKPIFKINNFVHLLKIGVPIITASYSYALWWTVNSTLVLFYLGTEQFGYYQLSVMTFTTLSLISLSFSHVLYPKLAFSYGQEHKVLPLIKMMVKPLLMLSVVSILASVVLWPIIPIMVNILLPQYHLGIEAARFTLGAFILCSLNPLQLIFNVLKVQKLSLISTSGGVFTYFIFLFLFAADGLELVDFPIALLIGYLFFNILRVLFIVGLVKGENNLRIQPEAKL